MTNTTISEETPQNGDTTPAKTTTDDDDTTTIPTAGSAGINTTFGPLIKVSPHPLLHHKISLLRSSSTKGAYFRSCLREITFHLGYEATQSLHTKPVSLTVPQKNNTHISCIGKTLVERVALVPIMRSGLGMVDAMLELVPKAGVHHIGMYKQNGIPVQYYNRLPRQCGSDVAYVLDPIMATAQTVLCVVSILKKWGVEKIHLVTVVASRKAMELIASQHPDVHVSVGEVDENLSDKGDVLPGIGDAGDRLYATPPIEDDEEDLMHPSKRKRSF